MAWWVGPVTESRQGCGADAKFRERVSSIREFVNKRFDLITLSFVRPASALRIQLHNVFLAIARREQGLQVNRRSARTCGRLPRGWVNA